LTTAEIAARFSPSVAIVQNRMGTGSGFLIRRGIVVTNAHVVKGDLSEHIRVSFPSAPSGSKEVGAELLFIDRKRDLAVLKVASDLPPLKLAKGWRNGENLVVIGSPGLEEGVSENAVTEGVLSNRETNQRGMSWVQYTAATNHGNSGGPVLNARGEVVCVVCTAAAVRDMTQMFLGIPAWEVQKALDQADTLTAKDPAQVPAESDFIVTYSWVAKATACASDLMDIQSQVFAAAIRNRTDPRTILASNPQIVKKMEALENQHALFAKLAQGGLLKAAANKGIREQTRDRLRDLWELHNEMMSWNENPRGIRDGYFAVKTKECADKMLRLVESIALDLGMDWKLAVQG
jgi:hypothetical protein